MNLYKFLDSFFGIAAKAAPDDKGTNYAEQGSKPFENADNSFLSDIRLTELFNAASAEIAAAPKDLTAYPPVRSTFGGALFNVLSETAANAFAANAAAKNAALSAHESGTGFAPFAADYRKMYTNNLPSHDVIGKNVLSDTGNSAWKTAEKIFPIITEATAAKRYAEVSYVEKAPIKISESAEALRTAAAAPEAVCGAAAQIHKREREPQSSFVQAARAAENAAVLYGKKAAGTAFSEVQYLSPSGTVLPEDSERALTAAGTVFLSAGRDKGGGTAVISAANIVSPQKTAISRKEIISLPNREKKFTSTESILPFSASVYTVNLNPKPTEAAVYKADSSLSYSGRFDGVNTENTVFAFAESFANPYQPVSEAALQTGYAASAVMAETEMPTEQGLINYPQKEMIGLRESAAEGTERAEEKIIREIRLSALNTVNSLSGADGFGAYTDMDSIISSLAEVFEQTAATGAEGVYRN